VRAAEHVSRTRQRRWCLNAPARAQKTYPGRLLPDASRRWTDEEKQAQRVPPTPPDWRDPSVRHIRACTWPPHTVKELRCTPFSPQYSSPLLAFPSGAFFPQPTSCAAVPLSQSAAPRLRSTGLSLGGQLPTPTNPIHQARPLGCDASGSPAR